MVDAAVQDRRGTALDALHRTAADIIAAAGVDKVLDAAVHRAQRLMASNLAYLSVFDPASGEIYVRAWVGARSPGFSHMRVPLGAGLGGVVAQQKSSYATEDYLSDRRLRHLPRVDKGIAAEGIRAMVGVPMMVRGRFTGALFAADRHRRQYTGEEIEHLEALGALVAVAIENARLLEDRENALDEIKAAYEALRTRSAAAERMSALHERVKEIVKAGSMADLVTCIAEALGADVAFLDDRLLPVAMSRANHGLGPASLPDRAVLQAAVERSAAAGSCQDTGTLGSCEVWTLAVSLASDTIGALLVCAPRQLLGTDQRTLEQAGYAASLILARHRAQAHRRAAGRARILAELLAGRAAGADLRERAGVLGIDLSVPAMMLALDCAPADRQRLAEDAAKLAEARAGLCCEERGCVLLMLPGATPQDIDAAHCELAATLATPVTVGWAGCTDPLAEARPASLEAMNCLSVLLALRREGSRASLRDLGMYALLLRGNAPADLADFVRRSLGAVLDYDRRHGTALADTLAAFFAAGQNASQAAQALRIHQKTMMQRLERIGTVLGPDWRSSDRSLPIQLALDLRRLGLAAAEDPRDGSRGAHHDHR